MLDEIPGTQNQCAVCQLRPIWNNKHLSLQVDHINGIRDDNRIDNLRLLCPNCHSQTNTFGGRNAHGSFDEQGNPIGKKYHGKPEHAKIKITSSATAEIIPCSLVD